MNALLACALLVAPSTAPAHLDEAIERARTHIESLQRSSGAPGVQVAVALGGEPVWLEEFGSRDPESGSPVTEETRFGIGSLTKTMTMAVCARLVDRGRLAWDEPIETYLRDFPHAGAGITVARIGAHLSGMGDMPSDTTFGTEWPSTLEQAWRRVANEPLIHEPGKAHLYATSPFALVAAVIAARENLPFREVVARELTEPLGMRNTVPYDPREAMPSRTLFFEPVDGEPVPVVDSRHWPGGSGYLSTARDLVMMGHAIVNTDFVSDENRTELLRDQRTNDGAPTFFALGWRIGRSDEWGLFYGNAGGGAGVAASLLVIPKFDVVVATVTNLTMAPSWSMTQGTAEIFVDAMRR